LDNITAREGTKVFKESDSQPTLWTTVKIAWKMFVFIGSFITMEHGSKINYR